MGREWLRRRAGVLEVPNFRRFYAGYVTSLLGSSMSTVAIAWAVLERGASATGLGTGVAVHAASYAVSVLALSRLTMPGGTAGGGAAGGTAGGTAGATPAGRRALWRDMAEGWTEFRSRTWLWATTVQFAFFNLITGRPGCCSGRSWAGLTWAAPRCGARSWGCRARGRSRPACCPLAAVPAGRS